MKKTIFVMIALVLLIAIPLVSAGSTNRGANYAVLDAAEGQKQVGAEGQDNTVLYIALGSLAILAYFKNRGKKNV